MPLPIKVSIRCMLAIYSQAPRYKQSASPWLAVTHGLPELLFHPRVILISPYPRGIVENEGGVLSPYLDGLSRWHPNIGQMPSLQCYPLQLNWLMTLTDVCQAAKGCYTAAIFIFHILVIYSGWYYCFIKQFEKKHRNSTVFSLNSLLILTD